MKIAFVGLMTLMGLSAAASGLAQSSHLTPISTNTFIYNDGPTILAPVPTTKPVFGSPPVWSTPITQQTKKTKRRHKAEAKPTPDDRAGKVTNNMAQHQRPPSK